MECKYLASEEHCTHKNNKDNRSRKKSGRTRKYPKRCSEDFCPIKEEFAKQ